VSTLPLKAARTLADTEPAKPLRRSCPVSQAPPVRAPLPTQRGRPQKVTFNLPPTPASHRPAAEPTQPLNLPPQSLGWDLWWCTVCSYYVSRLDRHMTYYTSHMLYICPYSPYLALAEIHSSSLALNVFTSLHNAMIHSHLFHCLNVYSCANNTTLPKNLSKAKRSNQSD
jgi:hypothetical protein